MSDQQSSRPGGIRWRLSRSLAVAFLGLSLLPIIVLTSISLIDQVANQRQTQIQRMSALADVGSAEAINWSQDTQASLRLILNDARNRQIIFTLAETHDPEVRDDFAQTRRSIARPRPIEQTSSSVSRPTTTGFRPAFSPREDDTRSAFWSPPMSSP